MAQVTTVIMPAVIFSDVPAQMICPNCNSSIVTSITKENGSFAYLFTAIFFLLCCICFWVPLVVENFKDTTHTCPNCNIRLGVHKKL